MGCQLAWLGKDRGGGSLCPPFQGLGSRALSSWGLWWRLCVPAPAVSQGLCPAPQSPFGPPAYRPPMPTCSLAPGKLWGLSSTCWQPLRLWNARMVAAFPRKPQPAASSLPVWGVG